LNKVYLQFPSSFWRKRGNKQHLKGTPYLSDTEVNFGNASSVNPEYYMFFDVGFDVNNPENNNNPNILHTLISGIDAVRAETLSDNVIVDQVMTVLKHLFSDIEIPAPITYRITRWCSDTYSQGAYSFLAPGSSDQDYSSLQSSLCAEGDFLQLGHSKTMRLFFAGEHTSTHYPSLAHGALLSGLRAAIDIFSNIRTSSSLNDDQDRLVPVTRYRLRNPQAPLLCTLCNLPAREKEGDLVSFQRDKRLILIHRNCAIYSPDVSYNDGVWRNVIKCVNRGRQLRCVRCRRNGATIGCSEPMCKENYHLGCCDPDWSFEDNGKGYLCASHREKMFDKESGVASITANKYERRCNSQFHVRQLKGESAEDETILEWKDDECKSISIAYYELKNPGEPIVCALCKTMNKSFHCGQLLAFDKKGKQVTIHEKCLMSSNTIRCSSDEQKVSRVFEIINSARTCFQCYQDGATVRCHRFGCFRHYHFECAIKLGCESTLSELFLCLEHMSSTDVKTKDTSRKKLVLLEPKQISMGGDTFSHDLFYKGSYRQDRSKVYKIKKRKRQYAPSNEFIMKRNRIKNDVQSLDVDNGFEMNVSQTQKNASMGYPSLVATKTPMEIQSCSRNATFPLLQGSRSKSVNGEHIGKDDLENTDVKPLNVKTDTELKRIHKDNPVIVLLDSDESSTSGDESILESDIRKHD
jgi:hypothetical protein